MPNMAPSQSETSNSGNLKFRRFSTLVSRLIFVFFLVGSVFIISGFFKFADDAVNARPPENFKNADGIVSLTGGSRLRLTEGVKLLQNHKGQRLLISGVFKGATADEVRMISGGDNVLYNCCVDLGREAVDTIGNAREINDWARKHGFKRIIIITDNYHMKRSMLEIRAANKNLEFIEYPVRADPFLDKKWWESEDAVRRLTIEYSKYLLANLRFLIKFEG